MLARFFTRLLILLGIMCAAHAAVAAGPSTDIQYGTHQLAIERGEVYSKLSMEGARASRVPGAPALPVEYLRFVIPSDARVADLVVSFDELELPGAYRVAPAQPEVPTGETPERVGEEVSIYGSDEPYPPTRVEYVGDGFLGGYRIATVAVHPLQYTPAAGRLVLATNVSVELVLESDADRSHPRSRVTANSDDLYRTLIRSIVENPWEVDGKLQGVDVVDVVGEEGFLPRYSPSLEGSPVEYVIITSDEFVPYFQPLADWKTKKGIATVIRTVSWIEDNYQGGVDTTERIRFFIQDAYESWGTTYVLIGGDTNIVPIREVWSSYYGGWDVSTDLYYSDLDGNWNWDGDSDFGEAYETSLAPGDSVDFYPDVFVGRAPAATYLEAETFVSKVLDYEKNSDPIFAARNLYMAEVLFPYDWVPGELTITDGAEHIVEPIIPLIPPGVHYARLYQNHVPFPGSIPISAQTAIDSLNSGYNIVAHVGHGNKDILRFGTEQYVSMQDIDALINGGDRAGLVWMLNCTTTKVEEDCISEHFMNNPNGGSSMLFGPTRFCFPTTAKDYFYEWHRLLYAERVERAGVVSAMSKVAYIPEASYDNTDRWTQMSYLFLGDPETRLWTGRPLALAAAHEDSMVLGPTDLTVTVTDSAAVDSAYVCVAKAGEVYETAYTDASGQAVLSFTPQTEGTLTVTVTARNHYAYEDTIVITSSAGAHLTLRSMGVDDDAVGASDGNANGRPEAGETVELDLTVGNGGLADAVGVTATLSTVDPYVTLVDDAESLGTVSALGETTHVAAFAVSIADSCPNDYDVDFTLALGDSASSSWIDSYTLRVLRPALVQLHNDISDGNDGVPDIGDTVALTVEIYNEGNGDADIVSGELSYPTAEVTVMDSLDTWGDIPAGTTAVGQTGFVFSISDTVTGKFELVLTDEDGKTWVKSFDVVAPAQPLGLDGRVKATTIYLMWEPVEDLDLLGYNVYRSDDPAGPFEQVNSVAVERIAYYEDAGLMENHLYYYSVTAVDSSGNEGAESSTLEISTNPPSLPGWPIMGGEAMYGSPIAADADMDGDLEVLVGSGEIYCWHHTGVELLDGDGDPRTEGVLAADGTGGYRASIAMGQLDTDPYLEIVAAAWGDVDTTTATTYEIWAWNAEDGTPLGGNWPVTTDKFCWATPTLADLNHDGLDDVVIPCANSYLYAWDHSGTGIRNPDGSFARLHVNWNYGSASVANMDDDFDLEIVVGSRSDSIYCFNPDASPVPGWPVNVGGDVRGSVAVGDVNGDGENEVVAGTNGDQVWLLSSDGNLLPNWPVACEQNDDFGASPVFADLDADGDLEIVMPGSDGKVHVWTWEGDVFSGDWPQTMPDGAGGGVRGSASIGNVDADPDVEIVIGSYGGKVYAFDTDGAILPGWPIQTDAEIYSSPTLEDLDADGDMEVIATGMDGMVYVWDCEGSYEDGEGIEWGTFRHDNRRTGYYGYELEVGVPGDGSSVAAGAKLAQNVPNPFNPVTTIAYAVPDGGADIDLAVFNVAGRRVTTLVSGRVSGGRSSVVWDGTDSRGEAVASGVYLVRLTAGNANLTRKIVLLK